MGVFKYRGVSNFSRDIDALERNVFYAAPLTELNDPAEGFVDQKDLMLQIDTLNQLFLKKNADSEAFKNTIDTLLNQRHHSGIYSLSKVHDNELLWAHYSDSHEGFCIEYDMERLFAFEKREGSLSLDVAYTSKIPKLSFEDLNSTQKFIQKIIGNKSIRWKYEQERRILTTQFGLHEYDFRAVKGIYFGLRMSYEKKSELMKRLQGRKIQFYQMKHQDGSYVLESKKIADRFRKVKKYMYHISPVASHAVQPEHLNKKWRKYECYLKKVAEIVRREPYCNLLEMVEVSVEKSSDDTPVFFGQYKRKELRYENLYYTIDEVDKLYALIKDLDYGK